MTAQPANEPQELYRREFLATIEASRPRSLLDIGCGDGALIAAASSLGIACHGIEPDKEAVAAAEMGGLDVREGHGESLPWPDRSFDCVVLQYVAHHLADLGRALAEAARVARRSVHIMDGWYDPAIASQRVTLEYDLWSKTLDRRGGMIHNPLSHAEEMIESLASAGDFGFEYRYRLILRDLDPEPLLAAACARLAQGGEDEELATSLEKIAADAAQSGMTEAGTLILVARRE